MNIWTKFRDIDNQQILRCMSEEVHYRYREIWDTKMRNQPVFIEGTEFKGRIKYWRCGGRYFRLVPGVNGVPADWNGALCEHVIEIGD